MSARGRNGRRAPRADDLRPPEQALAGAVGLDVVEVHAQLGPVPTRRIGRESGERRGKGGARPSEVGPDRRRRPRGLHQADERVGDRGQVEGHSPTPSSLGDSVPAALAGRLAEVAGAVLGGTRGTVGAGGGARVGRRDDRDLDRADRNRLGLGSGETAGSAPRSACSPPRNRSWGSEAGGGRCGALGAARLGDGRGRWPWRLRAQWAGWPDRPGGTRGLGGTGPGERRKRRSHSRRRRRRRRRADGSGPSAYGSLTARRSPPARGAAGGGRSRGKSDRLVPEWIGERLRHSLGRRARRAGRFARVRDARR